jgi:hypothetical protein
MLINTIILEVLEPGALFTSFVFGFLRFPKGKEEFPQGLYSLAGLPTKVRKGLRQQAAEI